MRAWDSLEQGKPLRRFGFVLFGNPTTLCRSKKRALLNQWVLKGTRKISYLNLGIGNPWAWHSKANPCPTALLKAFIKLSFENTGPFTPMGSTEDCVFTIKYDYSLYLNFGTGRPCAGQSNTKPLLAFVSYEKIFDIDEKVGAFDPIGSVRQKGDNNSARFTWKMERETLELDNKPPQWSRILFRGIWVWSRP